MRERGLEKWCTKNTKIIILGTFPSVQSRINGYYANPKNQFWKMMYAYFNLAFPLQEEERKKFLLKHQIGLWDVIESCEIDGSLDSRIKNPEYNDLTVLKDDCPNLECICFSSKNAFKYYQKYLRQADKFPKLKKEAYKKWLDKMTDGDKHILPSPSTANAHKTFEQKKEKWHDFLYEYIKK